MEVMINKSPSDSVCSDFKCESTLHIDTVVALGEMQFPADGRHWSLGLVLLFVLLQQYIQACLLMSFTVCSVCWWISVNS